MRPLLLSLAIAFAAASVVMGAYGHWRWREWMFGGATDHVLRNPSVPVLMIH
jgi:nucleotide-binding universal stress UspA family protein